MRAFVGSLVVLGVIAASVPSSLAGSPTGSTPATRGESDVYLALGDSLAVGYQPGKGETEKGYVNDLWRRIRERIPTLSLRTVGCAGESSRSMITGRRSPCHYAAGSQLDAAVAFLEAHPGQVAFITINIGSNDLFARCLDFRAGLLDRACAVDLLPGLQARLARIVDALDAAAGPGVPIIAMTYYNPLLGFWGLVPEGRTLARANQRVWALFNGGLAAAYEDAGATVADVAATFQIDNFTDTVIVPGRGPIPTNVALTCRWTWFCSAKFFGDPHANAAGYMKIGRTFSRELRPLLSA